MSIGIIVATIVVEVILIRRYMHEAKLRQQMRSHLKRKYRLV